MMLYTTFQLFIYTIAYQPIVIQNDTTINCYEIEQQIFDSILPDILNPDPQNHNIDSVFKTKVVISIYENYFPLDSGDVYWLKNEFNEEIQIIADYKFTSQRIDNCLDSLKFVSQNQTLISNSLFNSLKTVTSNFFQPEGFIYYYPARILLSNALLYNDTMYIYAFCEQGIGKHKKLYCFKYHLDNGQYKLVNYATNFY